ncbi:ABC transporter substrate-binding protein [Histidinibacterium lentulum]|nr:ABC transporter substrate-binding protein [Histidinibacterium lentulum]
MTRNSTGKLATPYLITGRRRFLGGMGAMAGVGFAPMFLGGAGPASAQGLDKVTHQLGWIKSIQFGGHFAAIEQGYFEEEGIEAEFLAGGPNAIGTDVAIATGQADTSDTDVDGTIRSRIGGMPIKAIAAIMQKAPGAIMSLAESPLTSLEDFPGKTIALPTGLQPQIDSLMTAAGLDSSEVTFVPVGTDPGMLAAGQVDGYYGWATNQGVMLMTRGVDIHIAYMNDLGVPGYAGVITATDETIAERGDVLTRWLRAEIRGWQWHLENPEEMAVLMVEKYGQRGLDLEAQTAESKLMADFVPIGDAAENGLLWVDPAVFEQGLAFNVAAGTMEEGAVAVEDVVTQELIAAAHGVA